MVRGRYRLGSWLALGLALLAAPGGAAPAAGPAGVELSLTTHLGDVREFVEGDRIGFLLSLNRAAHVYLFYRDAGGDLWQLLPNPRQPDHLFPAGAFQPLPGAGRSARFVIRPPFGDETVFAFASDRGELRFPRRPASGELGLMTLGIAQIESRIRAVSARVFDASRLELTTRPAADPRPGR